MGRRPADFDLDYDDVRTSDGLARIDDLAVSRLEVRLRQALRAGEEVLLPPSEIEALLALVDSARRSSTGDGQEATDEEEENGR